MECLNDTVKNMKLLLFAKSLTLAKFLTKDKRYEEGKVEDWDDEHHL